MNQKKIGSFIAARRKDEGMTQSQLAEKLGITDKAVSKWETGKSMPDLSLFKPLCELLEITLNELLAGEFISDENLKEKSDKILFEIVANWLGKEQWEAKKEPGASIVLKLENVKKTYGNGDCSTAAVKDISFEVEKGSFVGIMGASGSGKTTLLNMIATIDKASGGRIEINGQDIALLSDLAQKLGISGILNQFPYEISGGQRQRCACARAIATRPDLILADEPTGALDSRSAKGLLESLVLLNREYSATILMVTHDVLSASYCDRIFFMQDGVIKAKVEKERENRQEFFSKILDAMSKIEGGVYDVS